MVKPSEALFIFPILSDVFGMSQFLYGAVDIPLRVVYSIEALTAQVCFFLIDEPTLRLSKIKILVLIGNFCVLFVSFG